MDDESKYQLCLGKEKLELLFPFYFQYDINLTIISAGKSLKKMLPEIVGRKFNDSFSFKRPNLVVHDVKNVNQLTNQVIILESLLSNNLLFRGQFIYFEDSNSFMFFGSPWLTDVDDLKKHALLINDFAIHNTIIDMMQIIKTNEIATNDIKDLVKKLEQKRNNLNSVSTRLSALITNLQSAILVEDEKREILIVNQQFCDLFNVPVSPAQMIGMDCSNSAEQVKDMFENSEVFVERILELITKREVSVNELLYLKDGRIFERDFIPVFSNNEYQGHLWKYNDVSQKMKVDLQIRQNEEKFRNVLENLDLGMLEVDLNNNIVKAYPGFCRLLDYPEEELLGKNAFDFLISAEDLITMQTESSKREEGQASVYEVRIRKKNGELIWVVISGAPVYDLNKKVVGSIGIHWDITTRKVREEELKQAKEFAEQSSNIKRQFLANMSHEIRTPINVIKGMAEIVNSEDLSNENKECLDAIEIASDNLLKIINDILDISKIEAGKIELNKSTFNLPQLLEEICNHLMPAAIKKGIKLKLFIDNSIPEIVHGDDLKLRQILTNLLSNAIKFTLKGEVIVLIEKDSDLNNNLIFIVKDTGIGIQEDKLDVIFNSFTQADLNTNRTFGGTGLGLTITKEFVELMGGTITLNSKIGVGSEFKVVLNLPKAERTKSDVNDRKLSKHTLSQLSILVAEDNELNQLLVRKILSNWQCKFIIVSDGGMVLSELNKNKYDLILMDIQMPKMDGYEATKMIRKSSNLSYNGIPIIALTAHAIKNEKEKCIEFGMDEYLSKPFKQEELIEKILKLTDSKSILNEGASKQLFDLTYLIESSAGNTEFVNEALLLFLDKTPLIIRDLNDAIIAEDIELVKRITHKLKSNLAYLGLKNELQILKSIDDTKDDFKFVKNEFKSLDLNLSVIYDQINEYLNKTP